MKHGTRIVVCKNYDTSKTYIGTYVADSDGNSHARFDDGTSVPLGWLDENGDEWQYRPAEQEDEA